MKNIKIKNIVVNATSGAEIGNCIRECIELAAKEWNNVILIHNGKEYHIYVNDLLETIFSRNSAK